MEVLYPRCAGLDVHAGSVTACVRIAAGAHGHVRASHGLDDDPWAARIGRVAHGARLYARRDGGHGRVLEAGVARARRALHAGAGQRDAHPQRAGAQERHERCDVDRRSAGARADPQQLRAARADPGAARPDAHARATRRARSPGIRCASRRRSRTPTSSSRRSMSDILGESGRAILDALDRRRDRSRATGRSHARAGSKATPRRSARGAARPRHRPSSVHAPAAPDADRRPRDAPSPTIEARIGDALGPFRAAVSLLTTMPGLSETTARVLVAEIGTDMTRFPTVGHLISWAGFCPAAR